MPKRPILKPIWDEDEDEEEYELIGPPEDYEPYEEEDPDEED